MSNCDTTTRRLGILMRTRVVTALTTTGLHLLGVVTLVGLMIASDGTTGEVAENVLTTVDFMIEPLVRPTADLLAEEIVALSKYFNMGLKETLFFWHVLFFGIYGGIVYFVAGYILGAIIERRRTKRLGHENRLG